MIDFYDDKSLTADYCEELIFSWRAISHCYASMVRLNTPYKNNQAPSPTSLPGTDTLQRK